MWKRALISIMAMVGCLLAGVLYSDKIQDEMIKAANPTYRVGGNVTGRVNMAPSGISGSHIGLQEGDHVIIGGTYPISGNPLSFQLLVYDRNYTDYNNTDTINVTRTPISNWLSGADEYAAKGFGIDIGNTNVYNTHAGVGNHCFVDYTATGYYQQETAFTQYLRNHANTSLIAPRDLSGLRYTATSVTSTTPSYEGLLRIEATAVLKTVADVDTFFPFTVMGNAADLGLNVNHYAFSDHYLAIFSFFNPSNSGVTYYFNANGSIAAAIIAQTQYTHTGNFRPYMFLDMSNVVFGLSQPSSTGMRATVNDTFSVNASLPYFSQGGSALKLRLLDTSMNVTFISMTNQKGNALTKVSKDETIYLNASANQGTNHTISALIFDTGNHLIAYQPLLDTQAGNYAYAFDTTGLTEGIYKIALVNEVYDETSSDPSHSSLISNVKTLEIVKPLSVQVSAQNGLEYHKNVDHMDAVASITSSGGVLPITYSVISDTSISNHANDYQHFTVSGNNVVVKDASGLDAGDYYFKISAVDANGDPSAGVESVTVHLFVAKHALSVAFHDANQTKKSISDAQNSWYETALATPAQGTKITYAIIATQGNITTADVSIHPDTGVITYTGNGAYGKLSIQASADDDPNSGKNNYDTATALKEVVIYRAVNGSVTPDANSTDMNVPTFTTSDPNAKANGTIGKIQGSEGTPDNGVSGNTTYTYEIKQVDDYGSFMVTNTGEIKTKVNLGVKDHHITLIVRDQWSMKEIPLTIQIEQGNAENLQFYENQNSSVVINAKTVKFNDSNVSVFATVKGSSNTNPVTYQIKDGSTHVIEINSTSGVVTIKGVGTVTIVAKKQGMSGQAEAQAELSFTVRAGTQAFMYTTDSTLTTQRPMVGDQYSTLKEVFAENKQFHLYTKGNPTGSTVTYQLKAGSPTDVISVDPDGTVHILNASLNTQIGKVMVEAVSHDPSGNYEDQIIELPIDIEKGERNVAFADFPIHVISGTGSVTPTIKTNGVIDTSGNTLIEVDASANDVAWTNDGVTIHYDWSDAKGKDVKIHVTKPADRNYKLAEGDGILHILGADESALTLSTPGKITYGDHFTIRSTQDDSISSNVQYTFEVDNKVFVSEPIVNGNKAEFDALAYSGNTEITIKVTRTADGELPLTKGIKIKVLPKPITFEIEDKEKLRLEENPPLTFKDITSQLVTWNGVKDNVDTTHINLSTTAKKYSPIGSYPITAGNAQKQLNDNYPNYTFTIKDGLLNILDNGNKDFWDEDHDGCPDVNIEIEDDDGNTITINGDKNDDGIPDYNIDINGDGIPDLNLDTDQDEYPDLNLVFLKDWSPNKCVTLGSIQYSSGISAKAEMNVDTNGDGIPELNIDSEGKGKPTMNIDTDQDGKANLNTGIVKEWHPDTMVDKDGNQNIDYDTDTTLKGLNHIDTDGDGYPDLNIDLDFDGLPDLNINTDGKLDKPQINIDSDGDGIPDINIDEDKDGKPDKNIMEITDWKPDHDVKKDGQVIYDTMNITYQPIKDLEDNGVIIEKTDGSTFLPNMALKVIDVTVEKKDEVTKIADQLIGSTQKVQRVFDVKLLQDGKEVEPDGTLKIRIPISDDFVNAFLIRRNQDGSYEKIHAYMENGYLVYESDQLGIIAMIADEKETHGDVQGSYFPGEQVGGSLTGDRTHVESYGAIMMISILLCCLCMKQKQKR
ncbi:MAG: hypothetical protein HFE68_05260 [Erysipelotrichaceae bacterium]|nr:hypothetical protein [Erysipelotrichaceae bacterium]